MKVLKVSEVLIHEQKTLIHFGVLLYVLILNFWYFRRGIISQETVLKCFKFLLNNEKTQINI